MPNAATCLPAAPIAARQAARSDFPATNGAVPAELRKRGASGCVVLGYPQFYSRFGFKTDPDLVLPDMPPEYSLAVSFGTKSAAGTMSYHEAFNAVN